MPDMRQTDRDVQANSSTFAQTPESSLLIDYCEYLSVEKRTSILI
jgi:hypothetical protein